MTIPASAIVAVNPGVIGAGGTSLSLNGVILSENDLLPTSGVRSFTSSDAVSDFFGPASDEYALSQVYFLGYNNSTIKPSTLFFAPYVETARAAWLQSGSFAGVALTTIQGLSGVLTVTVDGDAFTSATINLSSATSFSNAAALITAGFSGAGAPTCTWNAVNSTFTLTSSTTGADSTITFATGTLSTGLKFTSATGAILSQGSDVDTPATAMDRVKAATQNWCAFTTMWEPNLAGKQAFAAWTTAQNQRYAYIPWDTDAQAIVNGSTTCFGAIAKGLQYDGVTVVSGDAATAAAQGITLAEAARKVAIFVLGGAGSIDFAQANGRITFAFKSQAGLPITVADQQIAANLLGNGYSFYGSYATANDGFNFLYNGQMTGRWKWLDTFVGQVYMNSQLQLALMSLLTNIGSVPYNDSGYSLIRAAMQDPINAALNFGNVRAGVVLSESQRAQVNQAAGRNVAPIIEQQGYYLQILDPGAQVRGNRGTPVINFWYTDGGAVQQITLASIDIM